jgi:hypothetical protein
MNTRYHSLELIVPEPGALVKFQYTLPGQTGILNGIAALSCGLTSRPGSSTQGVITLEALHRKIHLATLPVFRQQRLYRQAGFYPVLEAPQHGRLINGTYADLQTNDLFFKPYRVCLFFRTGKDRSELPITS